MWKEETGIISISLPDVSFEVYYFWFTQYSFKKMPSSTNQFSLCVSFLCRVTFYTGWTGTQHVAEEDPEHLLLPIPLPQCQDYRLVTKPDLMWYYTEARQATYQMSHTTRPTLLCYKPKITGAQNFIERTVLNVKCFTCYFKTNSFPCWQYVFLQQSM